MAAKHTPRDQYNDSKVNMLDAAWLRTRPYSSLAVKVTATLQTIANVEKAQADLDDKLDQANRTLQVQLGLVEQARIAAEKKDAD